VSGTISLLAAWDRASGSGRNSQHASSLRSVRNLAYILAEAE
jgi:hypothetical protein